MTQIKNAAMGVIRSGPIPNPGRYVPQDREANPKEILGIFVNPREDAAKPKKARNGMKRKKARSLKRRTTKKRASSAPKKRRSITRRRKTTAKRAARASNPRRKKRRAVVKKRRAAPRKKRRGNPIAPGYVLRAANPRRKRTKKRKASGGMTVAKMRNLLRAVARRRNNPAPGTASSALPAPSPRGRRGASMSALSGAAELKGRGLLDAAYRVEGLRGEIDAIQEELATAISEKKDYDVAVLSAELAQKRAMLDSLGSSMGILDAAILNAKDGSLAALREGLLTSSTTRRHEAASRAVFASKRKDSTTRQVEAQAAYAIEMVASGLSELKAKASAIPALSDSKTYSEYDPDSGKIAATKSPIKLADTDLYADHATQANLLMLWPEAVAKAIQMLNRNYIPTGETGAAARAELQIALDRLHALLAGRIENPRRKRRKGRKGSVKRKRRAKNPRKTRRAAKAGRRKGRKGRRRRSKRSRNPGGMALLSRLSSPDMQTRLMAAGQVALAATAGYVAVGLGEKVLELVGLPPAKLVSVFGNASNAAAAHTLLSALVAGLGAIGAGGWSKPHDNPLSQAVWEHQIPALIGIGARAAQGLVDSMVRGSSGPEKILRSSVGLAPSVAGYGSWSPDMGAYYNFQPVMGSMPTVGYQIAMAGAPQVGYQLSGNVKPGYTVNGYANYSPTMGGRAANPWGNPF